MEIFFSLVGVDAEGNIINIAMCQGELETIEEAVSYYEVKIQDGFNGAKFSIVNNPYDFTDIAADLNM